MGEAIGTYRGRPRSARLVEFVGSDVSGFARDNLVAYLTEQLAATGTLPTDRRIWWSASATRSGDWRLVVHARGGATAPWGPAGVQRTTARLVSTPT